MSLRVITVALMACASLSACSLFPGFRPDQGRLLATGAVSQIEGAAGSGLTTWSLISGYGSEDSLGWNGFYTHSKLSDFDFRSYGGAVGIKDRVEISYARQEFDTGDTGPALGLRRGYTFKQDVAGAKVRVIGNAVYDQDKLLPQISVGAQYKKNSDETLVRALGATDHEGVDVYVSGTKLMLNKSVILTATLRGTKANQLGLLGFGGDQNDKYRAEFEGSAAYMLSKKVVVGADYRTKPNNLAFAHEQDAKALYAAYFPNKHMSVTFAAVDLGDVALQGRQRGAYASLQVGF